MGAQSRAREVALAQFRARVKKRRQKKEEEAKKKDAKKREDERKQKQRQWGVRGRKAEGDAERSERNIFGQQGNAAQGKGKCCEETNNTQLELSGTQSCMTTDDEQIYCFHLTVQNNSGLLLQNVQLSLDIFSYQADLPFILGPGQFATATYVLDTVVPGTLPTIPYAGTGVFYTVTALPLGTTTYSICAVFDLPSAFIGFTRLLPATFSATPRIMSSIGCKQSIPRRTTFFVQPSSCGNGQGGGCPTFVYWSSDDSPGPENPCEDCTDDGVMHFAINESTGCTTHVCVQGTWRCIGVACSGSVVDLFTFQDGPEGWWYEDNAGIGQSWHGDAFDWAGQPMSSITTTPLPPNSFSNYLVGFDRVDQGTFSFRDFVPPLNLSAYTGMLLKFDWFNNRNNNTPMLNKNRNGNPLPFTLTSGSTVLVDNTSLVPDPLILNESQWQTMTVPLVGASFGVTDQELFDVLASLDRIHLRIEDMSSYTIVSDPPPDSTAEVFGLSYFRLECPGNASP